MTELEKLVWAAAFAAQHNKEYWFHSDNHLNEEVSGYYCATIANEAVEKLREALSGDDAKYLLPVKEGWKAAIPEEFIVPQEIKLSPEGMMKVLDLIENPPEPTETMKKLFKKENKE